MNTNGFPEEIPIKYSIHYYKFKLFIIHYYKYKLYYYIICHKFTERSFSLILKISLTNFIFIFVEKYIYILYPFWEYKHYS